MNRLLDAVFGPDPGVGLFSGFILVNLAVGVTILAVAGLRIPARRLFGPATAYKLWIAPLIVALLGALFVFVPADSDTGSVAAALRAPYAGYVAAVWAVGALAMAALFMAAQVSFMAQVRAGRGGPAVVGLIAPRVILPADDGSYTAQERELIRAHEREHVARKDPRAAAVVALFQCLCWFNPFAHLAAYLLRLDQELACDAAVVMNRPGTRALYARTLLKTQLAAQPLPFGCYWPARSRHPLELRVEMLKRRADGGLPGVAGKAILLVPVDAIRP